ncbi:MAG: hypothetical protein M3Z03_00630 [Actinomycetota bacterium]|nr:hypothetical protein [Actinomycetota bacterium]
MTVLRRVALVVVAAGAGVVGVWAQAFPLSFYDDFPAMGRVWVAVDGPYNEHLVRDVGGLQLALAFTAVLALVTGSVLLARAAGAGALISGVPHLLYHATHLDPFDTTDSVTMLVALTAAALAGLLAVLPDRAPAPAATR